MLFKFKYIYTYKKSYNGAQQPIFELLALVDF